ncbi:MAG TPA: CehA/McbA family metallohydrolase [Thermoanaerobaculia bacterium]|nr:CehA/McbA family metallohydrolase [Thermoanaerobaculia bacterium]
MRPVAACRAIAAFATLAAAGAAVRAERLPVLKQIDEPHPYYYREMYLPQVTSGPSAAAWSPDGTELVYAMQGTLWRQKLGAREAIQLTDGPGYDAEPDWSPDGKRVLYTSYRNDALELRVLELSSGTSRALVANGAVNLDARWSPDGARVAYVSTAFAGRFHVFVVDVRDGAAAGEPVRITEDHDSGLPRYYYSKWDQYLSPAWSPDGRELLVISNRGEVWGSGSIWRMEARAGAPMRLVRQEETNWKAHPDWARDGRRIVYSSYLGKQRNQLWLTTADAGHPFELTYCECDHTRPRWSPDGRRVAFVTNEAGNVALRVVAIPGGAIESVVPENRRYLRPPGTLRLTVADAAGAPVAARLSVTGADGRGWAPDDAWRHADDGFDRKVRPFELTYFHARGSATLTLPPGEYTVLATRGLEYAAVTRQVTVAPGAAASASLPLERLADLPARGWWSGDLHVHMNYGGAYRADPARLRFQAEAEDLHVVEDLVVNKEQRIPDVALFAGGLDPVSTATTLVKHDQEYHTSWWGHSGHLGLKQFLILPDYAGYAATAAASLFPDNSTIIDLAHAQGAISGYVHPFDPPLPDPSSPDMPTSALPVDVALGKADYIEVVGFSDHRTTAEVWYRLLNAGLRLPTGSGTDAMTNFASLRGPVGMNRVFARSGERLDYAAFLAAIKAGRTFATNGPLLSFTLDGREVGDEIAAAGGGGALTARVRMDSFVPVDALEIVGNGRVVATVPLSPDRRHADAAVPVPVAKSGWYVLRASAAEGREPVLDIYPYATTSPIYVTVGGRPIRDAGAARYFVAWIEHLEAAAGAHGGWNDAREKSEVLARLAAAKAVFVRLGDEAR